MTARVCSSQRPQVLLYSVGICRFYRRQNNRVFVSCVRPFDLEQRASAVIKSYIKLGENNNAVVPRPEKFVRDDCLSGAQISQRFALFQGCRESLEHDHRPDQTVSARFNEYVDKPRAFVMQDRRISTRLLAENLGVVKGAARQILERDLQNKEDLSKVFAPFLNG